MTLRRAHSVPVPFGRERHTLRSVPRHVAHIHEEHGRSGILCHFGRRDHERRDAGAGAEMFLAREAEGVRRARRLGKGARLHDVAAAARLRRHGAPPMSLARRIEAPIALLLPSGVIGRRRAFGGKPKHKHRRMHRSDQRHGRIAACNDSHHVAIKAHRASRVAPQPAHRSRDAGAQKARFRQPIEIGALQMAAGLARLAIGGKIGGDCFQLRQDWRRLGALYRGRCVHSIVLRFGGWRDAGHSDTGTVAENPRHICVRLKTISILLNR